ncbi:Smr/MutS family protein [Sphingomonas sp. HF-S4]|uniref:Smr/MutS family protein n=1 Tax=Sphingomonas agrestis TaxID=3080540 RepID=A0ABU3Y7Z9_9SPHN|nr:Smr/MutS family protein [Sphingomonas sp. HF-S4]MDV3457442.1 Smr/MutS family protein [Sphingomonas sp. HF-S4]
MKRTLATEEAALWKRVIETVTPLKKAKAAPVQTPLPAREGPGVGASGKAASPPPAARASLEAKASRTHPRPLPASTEGSANTLDGSWDRKLSRGLVSPESSIDLHGHSLSAAYDRLDHGLDQAIRRGDRVLLLITGKPPRPESERPHARGAIRAAVGDWLASSRHADRIAAVRTAHPRHGGSGALYIILRRPRETPPRKS